MNKLYWLSGATVVARVNNKVVTGVVSKKFLPLGGYHTYIGNTRVCDFHPFRLLQVLD